MSRVKNFLTELDDYELAYFAKFKLLTYMKETQSEIKEYLIERNLNESKIDRLISKNPKSKLNDDRVRCPRCYSDKLLKNKVEWTNTGGGIGIGDEVATWDGIGGRATYKYEVICNVCGNWLEDPNQEKPLPTSKKIFHGIWDFVIGVLRD
ncbi:hypothetical protein [Tenacibaculum sp. SG-28]|uniref:hypothetical protein n=1 Tax=Tenacibaculum sp. SG-28 TaxID=754426 RepID=UPI000CF43C95|nr:hypothetical protein [Tenacibaculum sp. SG-28]PQJ21249.1 hypothetical protein BSU00_09775 [Tenacibaculum sp. SG-28]